MQPAIMQIEQNGMAAFRTATRLITETAYVDHDLLCERSENMFGRPDCGPVYKNSSATSNAPYVYVNSSKVFYFSIVK
jgi:hypothetical protein